MAGAAPKKYGLIVPAKKKALAVKKPSVFEESSSDEEVWFDHSCIWLS